MKIFRQPESKIFDETTLVSQLNNWRNENKNIVFTNGVFDIIHQGHLSLLLKSASLADVLIMAINSDASVKRLKGPTRPINNEQSRALMLASLEVTDAIILFEEDTPLKLIELIKPDIMVKGGDYTTENIVGADFVINNGGQVIIVEIVQGFSTTATIAKILSGPSGNKETNR